MKGNKDLTLIYAQALQGLREQSTSVDGSNWSTIRNNQSNQQTPDDGAMDFQAGKEARQTGDSPVRQGERNSGSSRPLRTDMLRKEIEEE